MLLECHKTIDAAKTFRCHGCDNTRSRPRTRNIPPLLFYTLNHQVGVDVFEIIDPLGVRFSSDHDFLSFHTRLQAFVCDWSRRAGWSELVPYDRGTHDRGVFSSIRIKNGVMIRPAGLETPEQISRIERRGDMFKKMMTIVIKDAALGGQRHFEAKHSQRHMETQMLRHRKSVPLDSHVFPRKKTQLEAVQHSQLRECDPVHLCRPPRPRQPGDTLDRVRHATTQVPQVSVEARQHVHRSSLCFMNQNTDNFATSPVFTTVEFRD